MLLGLTVLASQVLFFAEPGFVSILFQLSVNFSKVACTYVPPYHASIT